MAKPLEGVLVARVTITRLMRDGETVDVIEAVDGAGDPLILDSAMGMLTMAAHGLYQDRTMPVDLDD